MSVVERSSAPRPRVWRALLWKEWRQLRHLRWACVGLGALMPVFFIAGAEAGRQGLSPFGRGGSYSLTTIFLDAVPGALAFAVWPLTALLHVAQAFAGDRASGTESFLLERPVSRDRVWFVRLVTCFTSLGVVMALTTILWALSGVITGAAAAQGWSRPLEMLGAGVLIGAAVAVCGILSSTLLPSPLLAILASALCAALPALLSIGLSRQFSHARWGGVPIGAVAPWLLIPLYLFVSFLATCRGEPAGRGRASRGIGGLVISMIVVAFVFVASAQAALRRDSVTPEPHGYIHPDPSGNRVLTGQNEVWLVDTQAARVLEHYPAPCLGMRWRPDGEMFALATKSGPLGSEGRTRVSFFDRQGKPVAVPYFSEGDDPYLRIAWSRDRLVIIEDETLNLAHIVLFDPGKGEIARMDMRLPLNAWAYAGTLWDGSDAIVRALPGAAVRPITEQRTAPWSPGEQERPKIAYGLYRADLSRGRIDPTPLFEEKGYPFGSGYRLSPDGRWWLRATAKDAPQEMVELATGRIVPRTRGGWPDDPQRFFLMQEGDATNVVQEGPDRVPRILRSWKHVSTSLGPSPGGQYLHVKIQRGGNPAREPTTVLEEFLYDVKAGTWRDLGPSIPEGTSLGPKSAEGFFQRNWVGPRTFERRGDHLLAFEEVDAIGTLRYVIGGPGRRR